MKEPTTFQKNNQKILSSANSLIISIDHTIAPLAISLVRGVLLFLAPALMIFSGVPVLYLLQSLMGKTFDFVVFLQVVGVGVVSWYVGFAIGQITKYGENASKHVGYSNDNPVTLDNSKLKVYKRRNQGESLRG